MLLEFADATGLAVTNTWFNKDESKLITYESGGCRTVVDYILVHQCERSQVKNVKVIPGEACLSQHRLMICILDLCHKVRMVKQTFVSQCKVWKLKDANVQTVFREKVQTRAAERMDGDAELVWRELKDCMLEVADEVCGRSIGRPRHSETWWWNNEVAEVIREKNRLFRIFEKSKNGRSGPETELCRARYQAAKRETKRAISRAQEAERKKFGEKLDSADSKGTVFRVAKQMMRRNQDVTGGDCVKDAQGKVVVEEEKLLEIWRAYYDKLSNEEFAWDKETLTEAGKISGPCEKITVQEVKAAVAKMKNNKAVGPSGVVTEMLKAAGEVGSQWVTEVCNAVIKDGKVPEDWSKSWMANVYKGKGDAMECGSYRGIKMLEHVMKILERVIEVKVRAKVNIDSMQFGFMSGKSTTDAIFIVRQLQEKYLAKKKQLWMAFVDLEKAFDRVPREIVWCALRSLGVDEWIVTVIKAMYEDATTVVRVNGRDSRAFGVRVGVHQGSVLSPLLFVIVMEALSRHFRGGLPLELLYADDLVLMAETEEDLVEKLKKWKNGMEEKGLRVNLGKTKVMRCQIQTEPVVSSGKWPCGVCKKGVGRNSIKCTQCDSWIHKGCSGITGKLQSNAGFRCKRCLEGHVTQVDATVKDIMLGLDSKVECVSKFRYLGDMIGSGGGVEEASRARVRSAWAKFNELAPILTMRGASLAVKGKVYRACVQSVLVYASETWAMKVEDMQRLERTERTMVRWMCGVTLKHRIASKELNCRLGIESVTDVIRHSRLRWFWSCRT